MNNVWWQSQQRKTKAAKDDRKERKSRFALVCLFSDEFLSTPRFIKRAGVFISSIISVIFVCVFVCAKLRKLNQQFSSGLTHEPRTKTLETASHLQQISVQDLLAAAGAHVLPCGRNRAGGGGRRAHGGGGRAAGRRVLPLHVGPLGLSVRVRLQEEAGAELRHTEGCSYPRYQPARPPSFTGWRFGSTNGRRSSPLACVSSPECSAMPPVRSDARRRSPGRQRSVSLRQRLPHLHMSKSTGGICRHLFKEAPPI